MALIIRQPKASADVSDIWEFIAEDSMDRADEFVDRISAKFEELAMQPGTGRLRPELANGLRSFPMKPYVIYYEAIPGGIAVIRVLHGARDAGVQFEN